MRIPKSVRFHGKAALGVAAAVVAGTVFLPADGAWAKTTNVAKVGRVETPLGTQGTRGAGGNVGIIFNLIDPTRAKTDVEVQYGYDVNGDGKITDGTEPVPVTVPPTAPYPNEYFAATEDQNDRRDTRRDKVPKLFTTAGDIGAAHEYVWKSQADIASLRLLTLEYQLTPQGRDVPDPDAPGSFKFAVGPNGDPIFAGVKVRVRAFRSISNKKTGSKRVTGAWVYSQPFSLNNNHAPSLKIDSVDGNGISNPVASDENVLIHWTAFDDDSEDLNGNGVLDVAQLEDKNNDGVLEAEKVGVAFDYHRVAANENPATMSAAQIAALSWSACSRAKGVADTDSMDARPGVPIPTSGDLAGLPTAPTGVGRQWTFAWNSVADVGTVYAKFVFRARAFDEKREHGDYSYFTSPIQLDNWKIFNPGSTAFPLAKLTGPRVGQTMTRIQSAAAVGAGHELDRGDENGANGFQSVLVAGGSASVGGGAVDDLDLLAINTLTSETSTSALIHLQFGTARSFHTATALDDGRILFVGGYDATGSNVLSSTEVYDPKTKTIVAGPTLSVGRAQHAAVKLASGDVAVFGGLGAGGAVLSSCEMIRVQPFATDDSGTTTLSAATWQVVGLPPMAVAQHSPQATVLPDETVLVTGGVNSAGAAVQSAQLLDPLNAGPDAAKPQLKSPVFITLSGAGQTMLEARKYGSATAMLDGNVLFAGGVGKSSLEVFNWQTRTFQPVGSGASPVAMQVARAQHVALLLGDGSVLFAGGADDPDAASPTLTADADVFKLGALTSGVWTGSFPAVNGDIATPRRLASAAVIDNGRVFIAGGVSGATPTDKVETFTPSNGTNYAPVARATLLAAQSSWLYGSPIAYRATDPEQDKARVEVQFIDRTPTGDRIWHACTPQATTIGGEVAESTAGLATAVTDDRSLAIDPVAHNTPGDHSFIWNLSADTPRPSVNATPYNVRVIPYGAIRGTSGESDPLEVLNNTKVVPTILPFENYADNRPDDGRTGNNGVPTNNLPAGTLTPVQGGDIRIWVHLRDLDGGQGNAGNPAQCKFEFAIDKNNDGQIKADDGESFSLMSASGAAVGHASSTNPQLNLTTYYEASANSDPAFGQRPAAKGWTFFDWDSVYDLGAPVTSYGNVWVRVSPSDTNGGTTYAGFIKFVRNINGQAPVLTIVRHPDSLYLVNWRPRYSNSKIAMPINDPIDFSFNGQIEPSTLTGTTLGVYRGTGTVSTIRGQYVLQNFPATSTSLVTFFPDPQNLVNGNVQYAQAAASTVLFSADDYSFRIPGYDPAINRDPQSGTTIRPLGGLVSNGVYSTYRLIHTPPINAAGTDANYKFHTANAGVYADDGGAVSNNSQTPAPLPASNTILRGGTFAGSNISFGFTRAIDPATAVSPNITATIPVNTTGGTRTTTSVVPGRWTVTNTQSIVGNSVASSATMTFNPLYQLPPTSTLQFQWNAGLKAFNGHSLANATLQYTAETYGRVSHPSEVIEAFTNQGQNDTTVTNAVWGTDGCVPGALTGNTNGFATGTPLGGGALSVAANSTVTLTLATNDYSSVTVAKSGTLILAATTGPCSLRATGDITIAGTLSFKGADGVHGVNGYNGSFGLWYAPTTQGTRAGGVGKNGGGGGGSSVSTASSNTLYRTAGTNGSNGSGTSTTGGQGGQIGTETVSSYTGRYLYGAGGGAGGGNALSGLGGGRPLCAYAASSGYGAASTGGSPANDAFFSSGMTAGGGGGGGGTVYGPSYTAYFEGGGGAAGAGAVSIVCNGRFQLTATGLIDGRGGNGGEGSNYGGAGGGGAGGNLLVVSLGGASQLPAVFDGLVDLRGGRGGVHGWGNMEVFGYINATTEKTCRYGGDGSPGRLVVVAPNFAASDEVRVYGQMMQRQIASLPTTTVTATAVPNAVFSGSVLTTTYSYGATTVLHWTTLNIAAGAVVDLIGTAPLQLFIDGPATINGTLRFNGNSTSTVSSVSPTTSTAHLVQNFSGQATYPYGMTYTYGGPPLPGLAGMVGNAGGGNGGQENGNTLAPASRMGLAGAGPAPGQPNANTSSTINGFNTGSYGYFYCGDSGGSGGANATDGEDGWAPYAVSAGYYYLGATNDTSGTGSTSQSGQTVPTFPKRLGVAAVDPTSLAITNLASFVGSGGGGGQGAGDAGYYYGTPSTGYGGQGGGGAGAVGIVSLVTGGNPLNSSITLGTASEVDARGGDGGTPGAAYYWYAYVYGHSGGGGGSGGTFYIAANSVTVSPVPAASPAAGATIDLRGGLGGGQRSQHPTAGLLNYPEYNCSPGYGGNGGYGRLVVDYVTSLNSGKFLANRWGYEQTTIDANSNTFKAMAGTSRFFCPGLVAGGTVARSKWYDFKSITPIVSSFTMGVSQNAVTTLRVEGAQSDAHAVGAGNIGQADPGNTSGLFTWNGVGNVMTGWRWFRWDLSFVRTTGTTGAPVNIDNMTATYTADQ